MLTHDRALLRLRLGPGACYLLTHPAHLEHVFSTRADNYTKGPMFSRLRPILGDGLLLTDGAVWRSQRRLLQPAFHPRRIRSLVALFDQLVERRLDHLRPRAEQGGAIDLGDEMRLLTMHVGVAALFSSEVGEADSDAIADGFDRALHHIPLRFFTYFLPEWLPLPGQRQIARLRRMIATFTSGMVAARARHPGARDDLLSLLLTATAKSDAEQRTLGIHQRADARRFVIDHVTTSLFGGYESTATSLTWVFLMLAKHPEVAERVIAEADCLLAGRAPTYEDLGKLHYLQQVIDESLRLFPPFWVSFRTAIADDCVGGVRLPAGASLLISPYATQRDPTHWPRPDTFDPARFAPDAPARPRFSYFPFLDGPRACIGKQLALLVIKLIVTRTLARYRFALPASFSLDTVARATVRPRQTPWVTLSPR